MTLNELRDILSKLETEPGDLNVVMFDPDCPDRVTDFTIVSTEIVGVDDKNKLRTLSDDSRAILVRGI